MKTVAIIYGDRRFGERMALALERELGDEWSMAAFADVREYEAWKEHGKTRVLLVEEAQLFDEQTEKRLLLLHEGRVPVIRLTTGKQAEEGEALFVYQSVEGIVAAIVTAERRPHEKAGVLREERVRQKRIYGVWPVSGGSGATGQAYRIAKELALTDNTLFLCLDPNPGFPEEVTEGREDVSELIYLLREYGPIWREQEENCVRGGGGFYYISGFFEPGDAALFGDEQARYFLSGFEDSDYWNLVIDFGCLPAGAGTLLRSCDTIYATGTEQERKWRSFERQMRNAELSERVSRLPRMEEKI